MANGHDDGTIPLSELLGDQGGAREAVPAFPIARRGYSPPDVDAYVRELLAALDETRNQFQLAARDAEAMWQRLSEVQEENDRHKAQPAFEGLGDHIDTLLTRAAEEADAIRARAEAEAASTAERAAREAEALRRAASEQLADAERQAAAIRSTAQTEAEEMRRAAGLEVTKILAQRDLGIAAIEELSEVLAKVAEEAKGAEPSEDVADLDAEAASEAATAPATADAPTELRRRVI